MSDERATQPPPEPTADWTALPSPLPSPAPASAPSQSMATQTPEPAAPPAPAADLAADEANARARLVGAVDVVRGRLTATTLPLDGVGVPEQRARRRELLDQIDDYLLPRLRTDGAPLLVVVGGSTGAGKSTLVNSLLGAPLTTPGVLRPTTRSPVLVHHPSDGPWFAPERILPTLARVATTTGPPTTPGGTAGTAGTAATAPAPTDRSTPGGARALRLAPYAGMPPGLALLDAPDIDSIEQANRELATQLLAAADLWLFTTTAARYADAVPWELLRGAAARRAQVALVLDRVDPGSDLVVADLARLAREQGLGDAPLFVVPEAELDASGMLPERAVADVAGWLTDLGGSSHARDVVALATRDGVVMDLVHAVEQIADAADAQAESAARLTAVVTTAYADARTQVRRATSDGAMLRGEVLTRWQDFVGASDVMRSVERGVGKVRDSVAAFFRGGRPSAQPVETAIAHGLEAVTMDALEGARERVRSAWRADPAGATILVDASATAGVTGASTADLRAAIAQQIRGWQEDVLAVVRDQGEDRRGLARALSFGVNGLGVSLMLVVFAGTGGVTGVELGIAGGTAVLAQKVLEAAFGDDAVRRLTEQAQARLEERLGSLLTADAAIALTAVTALGVSDADGPALRRAAQEVASAAAAERAVRVDHARPEALTAPGPALRGAHLRGVADAALSPYGGAHPSHAPDGEPGLGGPAAGGAAAGEAPRRPGFWRRLFGGSGDPGGSGDTRNESGWGDPGQRR
ncbi:dynamin family protein [Miniimonas sp. S16]|uniref:dynamin family protein n=1 Tax=Miniimonas sp. S16 TaxID=2171623 RepID=UPI00131EF7E8|nr:dynamin family protein [Miniimonas sp. S16]